MIVIDKRSYRVQVRLRTRPVRRQRVFFWRTMTDEKAK